MVVASSLEDEVQRAVQNRFAKKKNSKFLFILFRIFFTILNRAAQGRNTDQQQNDGLSENLFQPVLSPEQTSQSYRYKDQQSYLTSALSQDKTSLNETFQRIKIAGDFQDLSHIEDLEESVGPLLRALIIREKYYKNNFQNYITFYCFFCF